MQRGWKMIAKFTEKRTLVMLNEWYDAMGKRQFDLARSFTNKSISISPNYKRMQSSNSDISCFSHGFSCCLRKKTV